MGQRRLKLVAIFIALALFGLGWILLIAMWRLGRVGGWDTDDGTT